MAGALIRLRRNTWAEWQNIDVILQAGEQGLETDTGRVRIGDGHTKFEDLDYFLPSQQVIDLINEALSNAGAGDGGAAMSVINAHISSLTPHSVYDDGPSFLLLYENAKV